MPAKGEQCGSGKGAENAHAGSGNGTARADPRSSGGRDLQSIQVPVSKRTGPGSHSRSAGFARPAARGGACLADGRFFETWGQGRSPGRIQVGTHDGPQSPAPDPSDGAPDDHEDRPPIRHRFGGACPGIQDEARVLEHREGGQGRAPCQQGGWAAVRRIPSRAVSCSPEK